MCLFNGQKGLSSRNDDCSEELNLIALITELLVPDALLDHYPLNHHGQEQGWKRRKKIGKE